MSNVRKGSNQIPIGIVGSRAMVEKIVSVIESFPSFTAIPAIYADESEAGRLAESLSDEVEVLLLADALSHRRAKERVKLPIPLMHIPATEAGLYKALLKTLLADPLKNGFTVDTLTEAMVRRTLKDSGISEIAASVYDGPAYASRELLLDYHRNHYETGASSVAFTGIEYVSRRLSELDIPNEWLMPSDQDIIVSLERALLATETRRSREAQIVVGMINIDEFGKMALSRSNEHEVQKLKLDIHRMLLDYVESLDGYLIHLGGDEYLFFTTRGIFEIETGGYKTIPLAKDMNKTYGISLSIGVGFGRSASTAGSNARAAMRKAKEAGGDACFIVREDGTIIGPLEMADPIVDILPYTDTELLKRAENAGMTSAYLSKLLYNKARFGKDEYMAHELAALLGFSIRTAHRLLLQWIDHGLAEIAGMEKVPRGRPRQLFRILITEI